MLTCDWKSSLNLNWNRVGGKSTKCIFYFNTVVYISNAMTVKVKHIFLSKPQYRHAHKHTCRCVPSLVVLPPNVSSILWESLPLQIIPWRRRLNSFKNKDRILIWYSQQQMSACHACLLFFPACVCAHVSVLHLCVWSWEEDLLCGWLKLPWCVYSTPHLCPSGLLLLCLHGLKLELERCW